MPDKEVAPNDRNRNPPIFPSSTGFFLKILLTIFIVEALVMLFLPALFAGVEADIVGIVDAFVLAVIVSPFVWWLITKRRQRKRLKGMRRSLRRLID